MKYNYGDWISIVKDYENIKTTNFFDIVKI